LERFASAISHDLKSPLLSIRGFLDLLETDFEAVTTGAGLTTSLVFRVGGEDAVAPPEFA